ncbi:hypothetical protein [Sphaerimonospora thailandensis]|uniref:Uncharacterized protein n=1 Tax=Sphaerimonospora thailandensis TaxID=795644 RepID=A0A8J3VZR8_9ACTN|nr:hypothetical protein [Sphaerimonospora thailandensis]GIH70338.1 hypothetical protein Mth01_25910 [Sphaerimonospora thailandensis]
MRAIATQAFKAYYNMQPLTFAAGEEFVGDAAVYMLRTGAPVEPADDEARQVLAGHQDGEHQEEPTPDEPGGSAPGPAEEEGDDPDGQDQGGPLDINGTISEILAWVGVDEDRALEAHDAEQAKAKPRPTLLSALDAILD